MLSWGLNSKSEKGGSRDLILLILMFLKARENGQYDSHDRCQLAHCIAYPVDKNWHVRFV